MNQPAGRAVAWRRTLRTPSSERFLALSAGPDAAEVAAVDIHYLPGGTVTGTVIVLESAGWTEDQIPALLRSLDEEFLPDVDLESGGLTYTVVVGRVLGNFEASATGD